MTANCNLVNLADGRVVTTSYGVPVAVFVPKACSCAEYPDSRDQHCPVHGDGTAYGYLKTDRKYSTTTSRHASLYARQNGSEARTVPHAEFRLLVAPIETEA